MKKIIPIVAVALLAMAGCREHVYHTYYGDIDIDTMDVVFYDFKDSLPCYLVHVSDLDSVEKSPGEHVYHSYYGDIDIDTMDVAFYDFKDSLPCYLVHVSDLDSVEKSPGVWGYIYGPLKYYYCPAKDTYYHTFPDNQGREVVKGYDPKTDYYYAPEEK